MSLYAHTTNEPKGNSPIIVSGSATVTLSSGAGTLTIPNVHSVVGIISLDTYNASSSSYTLVKTTGAPSGNSIPIEVLVGTVGGTAANPTLSTATSITVYYVVLAV